VHVGEIELVFSNTMHQFDAGDRNGRAPKAFEVEHRIDPGLDVAMVLLDQVAQVLRRSERRVAGQQLVDHHFSHRAVRRCVAVQRNGLRSHPLAFDRLREEGLGGSDIAPGGEPEIDRFPRSINGTVKIGPFAADLYIRLVDSPGPPSASKTPA
jgi:hypothetical protein